MIREKFTRKERFLKDLKFYLNTYQESNFVELLKSCKTLKLIARISKFFVALLIIFTVPAKLFLNLYPAKFWIPQSHSFRIILI